jgi:hypothetical protein
VVSQIAFHAHDGWYFERLDDGSVKISAAVNRCTEETTLTADTWASIIAAVSDAGDTSQTFYAAQALHTARKDSPV